MIKNKIDLKKYKYNLINYFDVYGNEEGFEVNNICKEFENITIPENIIHNNALLIEFIIALGFFSKDCNLENIDVWNDFDMIEFFMKENSYPLCRLERINY